MHLFKFSSYVEKSKAYGKRLLDRIYVVFLSIIFVTCYFLQQIFTDLRAS
jgi:cell division protein FtsB